MKDINFKAAYGDDCKEVEITDAHNGGGHGYQMYVDRYYWGCLKERGGRWLLLSPKPNDLTTDDLQILGQMIVENQY